MKRARQLIIGLAIALLAIWYVLRNISMGELIDSFKTVQYIYILPAVVALVLVYVIRAYRWQILLHPLKPIPAKEIYSPLMVGFMSNLLPARAGEVIRAWLLAKKHNLNFTGAFATIVVERVFDLVMVLSLFVSVLVFYSDVFKTPASWSGVSIQDLAFKFGVMGVVLIVALLVFIYMLAFHHDRIVPWVRWCLKPLPEKWSEKILELMETFSEGLHVARDPSALWKVFLFSAVCWVMILMSYYPFFWAYDLNDKSFGALLITVVLVCILITLLPTPAFLGSFQAGMVIGLHNILGEPELTAISLAMVCWFFNFLVVVVMGMYYIVHDHISMSTLIRDDESGE